MQLLSFRDWKERVPLVLIIYSTHLLCLAGGDEVTRQEPYLQTNHVTVTRRCCDTLLQIQIEVEHIITGLYSSQRLVV